MFMSNQHKVELLTFHGSVNYGAVLQGYALYKRIEDLGLYCEVIDYNRIRHHQNYLRINWRSGIKSVLFQLFLYPKKYQLHRKFNRFVTSHLNLSEKAYNGYNALNSSDFQPDDYYLIGSDQVWNSRLTEKNYHYFLDFVNSKNKFSYASSFGVSDIEDWEDKGVILDLLRQFRRISVREETGQAIIKRYLGIDVDVVCDPTFLLTSENWRQIAVAPRQKNYILLFLLSYNEVLIESAKRLADEGGLEIINLAYSVKNIPMVKNVECVSPEEFLGYIDNAEYVLTNSFHGFALSLNFNKQVIVALSNIGRNSRIIDLAQRYGVSNRIIDNEDAVRTIESIDYQIVNRKIDSDRQKSVKYLEEVLNAAKG